MKDDVLKIACAAFLHDIGKFVDADVLDVSKEYLNNNADLYQPHYKGVYTHKHAVYTAAFIEKMGKLLPPEFNRAQWGTGDSFINLAAGHHMPESPMQWAIAIADRVSSGWDRDEFEKEYNTAVAWQDYKKTRLLTVFKQLRTEGEKHSESSESYSYCYPLKEIAPAHIFPKRKEHIESDDNEVATSEYKALFKGFVRALKKLLHKEENLALWLEHFESLMMVYTSSIPSARAGNVIPDISLYDHSKTTAALAVAIYLYHKQTDSLTVEAIKDYSDNKFLIISGDFYGIQNFIFCEGGDVRKHRAKMLRGRSFAISLFSELAADMLCRKIGIPSISIVLNAAGKFTIIAPNTPEAKNVVCTVENKVNDWLMEISYGESTMGIATFEATANDFVKGRFIEMWDVLAQVMEKKKFQKIDLERHGGAITDYLDAFHDREHPLCPFCGKRPSSIRAKDTKYVAEIEASCDICRDNIFLGENLVKKDRMAILTVDAEIKNDDNKLLKPIFGYYQVAFLRGGLNDLARFGQLLKYWDISISPDDTVARDITARFLNGYVPKYTEEDHQDDRLLEGAKSEEKKLARIEQMEVGTLKTFEHIANKALISRDDGNGFRGIEALGVLKADVDNLGMLMSCGLKQERLTLSRMATLSRQINWYFAIYLPYLLKTDTRFKDVYTVFAGGDDLFLIGPWNRIIELAEVLYYSFADYVCHNQEIHFSAGISLYKPNTPLDSLAESAESALERSKAPDEKNSITLFGETTKWPEFIDLLKIKEQIEVWRNQGLINNAMIYRLNDFIELARLEKLVLQEKKITMADLECLKWPAKFCYSVERNIGSEFKDEARKRAIQEVSKAKQWLDKYKGKLKMALWYIIYSHR